jgi:CBS domain-containing protein
MAHQEAKMRCEEIMKCRVMTVIPESTIQQAAKIMQTENIGFVPVCTELGTVVGTVTDRDLAIRALAEDRPNSTAVSDIMSRDLVTCRPDQDIQHAEELMGRNQVSRILVTRENGRLEGVISLSDLVQHLKNRPAARVMRQITDREVVEVSPEENIEAGLVRPEGVEMPPFIQGFVAPEKRKVARESQRSPARPARRTTQAAGKRAPLGVGKRGTASRTQGATKRGGKGALPAARSRRTEKATRRGVQKVQRPVGGGRPKGRGAPGKGAGSTRGAVKGTASARRKVATRAAIRRTRR